MVFRRTLFRRVAILGTGLIGGSIGLAMKKEKLADQVFGLSGREESIKTAIKMGAIEDGTTDMKTVVYGADLVILAGPVKVIISHLQEVGAYLRRGTIVTDVGSTKSCIVDAAQKYLPAHIFFVGSHPVAGSEKSGIINAQADLFKGAECIMTPNDKTNRGARDKVRLLWEKLGMQVRMMDAQKHDEVLAYVSHLPHIAAFSLIRSVPDDFLAHGATGLRDTTRLAGASAKMWKDIVTSNGRNLLKGIDEMTGHLAELRQAILAKDEESLATYFQQANAKHGILDKQTHG
jgi:prephenate dehydrogenase